MEIKDDKLVINTQQVDAVGGAKPEPEERPAERRMDLSVNVSTSMNGGLAGSVNGAGVGHMPGAIAAQMTVGEFLSNAKPCSGCVHFNRAKMKEMLARWKQSTDPFDLWELDKLRKQATSPARVRAMIAQGKDPDAPLFELGICMAWSLYYLEQMHMTPAQSTTIADPLGVCPSHDLGGTKVAPFYKAREDAAINKIRDDVLFKAAGKKP